MALDFSHVTIDVPLVSLQDAKQHLRITDDDHDDDITDKRDAAQAQIVAKLMAAADETWTEATLPRPIRASILMLLEALYDREYDRDDNKYERTMKAIDDMLDLWRDPTLA